MQKIPIQKMVLGYRKIRKDVYEKATIPASGSKNTHSKNQQKLKSNITKICEEAKLELFQGSNKKAATLIWHHLWTKIRYARIKALIAEREIADIKNIFDDYEAFCDSSWNMQSNGHKIINAGNSVQDFLKRAGRFKGCQTIGNIPKLSKIISLARQLKAFMDKKSPNQPVLDFITASHSFDDVWSIHKHLLDLGYKGDLTALHFMMDLGF